MNDYAIVEQPEIVTPSSYLTEDKQSSLNNWITSIKGKIGHAFKTKLDIILELEQYRWTAEWLDDHIWVEWDKEYQAKGKDRAPREWHRWLSMRGLDGEELEVGSSQVYQRWLCVAILYRVIEMHNAGLTDIMSVSPATILPLPTSHSQVISLASMFERGDLPDAWVKHKDGFSTPPPLLPPEKQTHLIDVWKTAWESSPKMYKQVDNELVPIPPSYTTVRTVLEEHNIKEFRSSKRSEPDVIDIPRPTEKQQKVPDKVWEGIHHRHVQKAKKESDLNYDSGHQSALREQAKQQEQAREHRSKVVEYNRLLVQIKRSVKDLESFVTDIDRSKGTQYFTEMRGMKFDLITVADDVSRLKDTYELLKTVCQKVTSHNPPSGIEIQTINV